MGKITAAITGVGQYLPEYILTNDELSRMVDTNDEWIMSHTGIKTRHILKGEGVGTSYMGARAVINLLDKAGVDPMEVDLVICATVTPDMFFPSTGNLIADQAGCKNAFAYDVSAACSGFLFALTTGAKFIESGSCKKVVVVGADKMSTIVDYTDRSTCPLFGDAAAAVLLEANTEGFGVVDSILHSDGSGEMQLYMKAGGSRYPASVETVQNNWHTIMWDGHAVFKAAVSKMADVSVEIMERNNLTSDDIRYLVPHQANLRIIAPAADLDLLKSLGDDLKFVFITSKVELAPGDALQITVSPSTAQKCERCWHYRDDVGSDPAHPALCGRCSSNLYGAGETREFA